MATSQMQTLIQEVQQVLQGLNDCRYRKNIQNEKTLREIEYYIKALTQLQQTLVGNSALNTSSAFTTSFPLLLGTPGFSVPQILPPLSGHNLSYALLNQPQVAVPASSSTSSAEVEAYAAQLQPLISQRLHQQHFQTAEELHAEVHRHVAGEMAVPSDLVAPIAHLVTSQMTS